MIPIESVFEHLTCVYGKGCNRPYCRYSHNAASHLPFPSVSTLATRNPGITSTTPFFYAQVEGDDEETQDNQLQTFKENVENSAYSYQAFYTAAVDVPADEKINTDGYTKDFFQYVPERPRPPTASKSSRLPPTKTPISTQKSSLVRDQDIIRISDIPLAIMPNKKPDSSVVKTTEAAAKSHVVTQSLASTCSSSRSYRDQMINRLTESSLGSLKGANASASRKSNIVSLSSVVVTPPFKSNDNRTAHTNQRIQLLPLDLHSAKISLPVRTLCLQKLHAEFLQQGIDYNLAVKLSQQEEKTLLDRCQTQSGYTSSLAGVVRGIRNKQFTLPTSPTEKVMSVYETMTQKRVTVMEERVFYAQLRKKYILSELQLHSNGYPYTEQLSGEKCVNFLPASGCKTLLVEDEDYKRQCRRCGTPYEVKTDGEPLLKQDCVYHWKRPFSKRFNSAMETVYGCCHSDLTVQGCVVRPSHVNSWMRRSELNQFVNTPQPVGKDDERCNRVYALDCEMVYTTWGMSLARLTMVDMDDHLVLDFFIRPTEKVIDYNTKFSGITESQLLNASYNLEKARNKFFKLVNSKTILIGHSLENDLRALRVVHNKVVDTSIVFPHPKGPPRKRALRYLASDYLQKIIQEDTAGHDSKEDASACMQLMLYKVRTDLNMSKK